jgi:acyl-coenzyme A thioesterase PaaI-like protein
MTATNRLSKLVKATAKLPKGIRSTLWSKAFGRIVPMVGSANIRYLEVSHAKVVVKIENHRAMQNHIGQVHACAMALIAETATGFVTGMNVPDSCIVLIKSLKVDFKRPSKGAMTAVATLTDEQQKLMQSSEKGETLVSVIVTDETNQEPIQCEMLWAWVAKSQLKK